MCVDCSSTDSLPFRSRFALDPFAFKQFDDESYGGTRIAYDKRAFAAKVSGEYSACGEHFEPSHMYFLICSTIKF